ncbi:MAG TPA: preprotein translocase subunit SecG [Burkholderiales bacterium]|nr:preprotein translocase subunit SecG [Burkholderiales bacterium]
MLTSVLIVVHVVVALAIIGLVLLQHGKGADMGSGFGGGSSGSLFGATGSANFLSRTTAVLAAIFFALSLALAYLATNRPVEQGGGVLDAAKRDAARQQDKAAPPPEKKDAAVPQPPAEKQVPQ